MKKLVCIVMVVMLLCAVLTACSAKADPSTTADAASAAETGAAAPATDSEGGASATTKKIKIGWAPPDITNVFKTATQYMENSVEEAKKAGIDIEIVQSAANAYSDSNAQVKSIENLINSGIDVLISSPGDVEACKPALKKANEKGIPIIIVNLLEPIEGVEVASYIGFDNVQAAAVSAYSLLDALGGPGVMGEGEKVDIPVEEYIDLTKWEEIYKDFDYNSIAAKVAYVDGVAGNFFSTTRSEGFHSVIDQCPNIEIVAQLPAEFQRQPAITVTENILQSNKELDAIYASCAEMGIGASIAIKNAKRQDEVFVVTNDGTQESVDMIRSGDIMAETWHGFPEWGWYGAYFATQLALGQAEDVPETFDIRPRTEYKGNADQFYPNVKLDALDYASVAEKAAA